MTWSAGHPIDMRPCGSTYGIVCAIIGMPILFNIMGAIRNPPMWWIVCILILVLALLLGALSRYRVRVIDGVISYRTLFGEVSLQISDIAGARIEAGVSGGWDLLRPLVRLSVLSKADPSEPAMRINVKLFCRPDVEILLEALGQER